MLTSMDRSLGSFVSRPVGKGFHSRAPDGRSRRLRPLNQPQLAVPVRRHRFAALAKGLVPTDRIPVTYPPIIAIGIGDDLWGEHVILDPRSQFPPPHPVFFGRSRAPPL